MHVVSHWRSRLGFAAIFAAAAFGLTMVLATAPSSNAQAAPTVEIKQLTLTGAEENPPVTSNTVGYFSGTLRDNALDFDLSAVGPAMTQSHIHQGAKGTNGPVVAFLFGPADPAVGALHPTGTITVANLVGPLAGNWKGFTDAMAKGELYVNVHSTANPGGVVRAQIPATTLVAPKPPATGNASGVDESLGLTQGLGLAILCGALATGAAVTVRRKRS
jgi:hypothetical protein